MRSIVITLRGVSGYLCFDGNIGCRHSQSALPVTPRGTMRDDERWPRRAGGHLAHDFVTTEVLFGGDAPTDILRSADEFHACLSFTGSGGEMTARSSGSERSLLKDSVALRAALRSSFETLAVGSGVDPEPL